MQRLNFTRRETVWVWFGGRNLQRGYRPDASQCFHRDAHQTAALQCNLLQVRQPEERFTVNVIQLVVGKDSVRLVGGEMKVSLSLPVQCVQLAVKIELEAYT